MKEVDWLLEEKYNGEKSSGFFTDLKRLEDGEPLAYVIGFVPFLNTKIYLDSHPLIPRVETEFWVEKAIEEIAASGISEPKVLDLCAGSGCIGSAVAKAIPTALVDFAELQTEHHSVILKNCRMNGIEESRIRVFDGDLFEKITDQYDYILSNPPYIDPTLDRTEGSVKNFEPHVALYGGDAGMEIIERIIKAAPQHLTPNGRLYIEHEPEQSETIKILAEKHDLEAKTHQDQYGVLRYSRLKKGL